MDLNSMIEGLNEGIKPSALLEAQLDDSYNVIDVRVVNRTKRKRTTVVEGLEHFNPGEDEMVFFDKLAKIFRKKLNCSATPVMEKETKKRVIKLSGNKAKDVKNILVKEKIAKSNRIKIRGV